jgi:hypothetical protein
MSNSEPTEIMVALHVNRIDGPVLVSIDGDNAKAKWIGRKLIGSLHETGRTTRGTDRNGDKVTLPLANLTVPEWLAKKEGFI